MVSEFYDQVSQSTDWLGVMKIKTRRGPDFLVVGCHLPEDVEKGTIPEHISSSFVPLMLLFRPFFPLELSLSPEKRMVLPAHLTRSANLIWEREFNQGQV